MSSTTRCVQPDSLLEVQTFIPRATKLEGSWDFPVLSIQLLEKFVLLYGWKSLAPFVFRLKIHILLACPWDTSDYSSIGQYWSLLCLFDRSDSLYLTLLPFLLNRRNFSILFEDFILRTKLWPGFRKTYFYWSITT